ncbi:inositol monophosphatase family protein [Conexibacter woesei]|uniref:Inositol monophosphatase n=1 Tax=Conexibacter woesei (strain DSM 14684 / CCUG 47730 / CIP 108061 / JCM 11494 / NBRC 100937 / ID131577) TaxID=469383 RepID=D3F998_CONWI|nr:inositol monophosphatase [Conexibacter woesei]ADB49065.1 inositol monophosphatase [Conexibacter woesei DSM 14684]
MSAALALDGHADALVALVREVGDELRAAFEAAPVTGTAKGGDGDLVTVLDVAAEDRLVAGLRARFPDDAIWSEERGAVGPPSSRRWLVDPLDGTNNVVLGLPLYGVCLTLLHDGAPRFAIVHDAHRRSTAVAAQGGGATLDGRTPTARHDGPLRTATVSWLQGHAVGRDDASARRIADAVARRAKRVLRTWAPSVDWLLAAQGRVGAVVAYKNELEDLLGGCLLVAESGGVVVDGAGRALDLDAVGTSELTLAGAPAVVAELATVVRGASA